MNSYKKKEIAIIVIALIYCISPIDIIPFVPIDDIAVLVGGFITNLILSTKERQICNCK